MFRTSFTWHWESVSISSTIRVDLVIVQVSLTCTLVLSDIWRRCPAKDWRNAALVDQYNAAVLRVVDAASEGTLSLFPPEYLDTSFITKPMWDSPPDWCHFENEVGRIQSIFIAAKLLGIA
jgi:hypothetical protein